VGCSGSGGVLDCVLLREINKVGRSKACFEWVDEGWGVIDCCLMSDGLLWSALTARCCSLRHYVIHSD
jgi:hypothetical protein